jgi:hypothetical protein
MEYEEIIQLDDVSKRKTVAAEIIAAIDADKITANDIWTYGFVKDEMCYTCAIGAAYFLKHKFTPSLCSNENIGEKTDSLLEFGFTARDIEVIEYFFESRGGVGNHHKITRTERMRMVWSDVLRTKNGKPPTKWSKGTL